MSDLDTLIGRLAVDLAAEAFVSDDIHDPDTGLRAFEQLKATFEVKLATALTQQAAHHAEEIRQRDEGIAEHKARAAERLARIGVLVAANDRLKEQAREAVEALKPFAEAAAQFSAEENDGHEFGDEWGIGGATGLMVGDLRRAARVSLSKAEGGRDG